MLLSTYAGKHADLVESLVFYGEIKGLNVPNSFECFSQSNDDSVTTTLQAAGIPCTFLQTKLTYDFFNNGYKYIDLICLVNEPKFLTE